MFRLGRIDAPSARWSRLEAAAGKGLHGPSRRACALTAAFSPAWYSNGDMNDASGGLEGRVALITGATGGLGRATAQRLSDAGAVVALGGTDVGRLEEVARELGLPSDRWVVALGDLTDRSATREAVDAVVDRFGRVDILVHAIGGYAGGTPIVELDHQELRDLLDQHLWTTLNVMQAVVPGMVERRWGRVIAVAPPLVVTPMGKAASYAVSKAAQDALIRTLAKEVASSGVTANLIVVKAIDEKGERAIDPKKASWTTPDEIASTILYLCSEEAAAINGARIPLDGRA
jgi:NAD(P)-dependent dehydrogenase (short-subunit alcohol dehydrogenase family)